MTSRTFGLVLVAGAALRFATLDAQSFWYDEAVTAHLLSLDLGGLLRAIPDSESTPPLYYLLAWLWTHVFGTGEVGLRSLSALIGTATIGTVWALGRRLGGERAGLAAAALVAFNPMLIWFSQEARSYALLALLAALSALLWLRALEEPRAAGRVLAWGAVAAAALATHYFAIFLVGPQTVWLVWRAPGLRARATALALPGLAGLALAPLALGQRANDSAAFIGEMSLERRLIQIPKQFLVGYDAPIEPLLVVVSALAVGAGLVGLAGLLSGRLGREPAFARARSDGARIVGVTALALGIPVLSVLAGEDHLITRNVIAALPLLCALAGAGLAALARVAPRPAALATGAVCLAGTIAVVAVARDPWLQRDDWRGAVAALGPVTTPRLIVATPESGLVPLREYLPGLRRAQPPTFTTDEIDYLAVAERPAGERARPPRPVAPAAPAAGYRLIGRTDGETFTVLRWRGTAPRPEPIAPSPGLDGESAALLSVAP